MKHLGIPLFATAIASAFAGPSSAQTVTPVQFARGASSAVVPGGVQGERYVDYRVVVRARQQMSVGLRTISGSPYFNVMEPGSTGEAIYNSSTGEQNYLGQTARSGAYTIRVYQMGASSRGGANARFQLLVGVTDENLDGQSIQSPGDALVPGTPYHATALIRCRTVQGADLARCNAGVIRRGADSATVHIDTPGGQRVILFRGGAAVSSDGGSQISVEKRLDTSVVQIGDGEVYEIPDAFIFGG